MSIKFYQIPSKVELVLLSEMGTKWNSRRMFLPLAIYIYIYIFWWVNSNILKTSHSKKSAPKYIRSIQKTFLSLAICYSYIKRWSGGSYVGRARWGSDVGQP